MQRRSECIDPDDVAAFLEGVLRSHEVALVETHVARCVECRTLLSLAARSESVAQFPSSASQTTSGSLLSVAGDSDDPRPGTRVGRYVLGGRRGAGAMGLVFAAHDPELDRKVAIKLIRSDVSGDAGRTPLRERLRREAQAMAQLAHPNVVAVHDVGAFGDRIFIAMELIDGQSLAEWLAAERRPARDVLARFIAAGHGLAAAHAAGLVHRDFKPENVLIGNDGRVRVTDFGLAHRTAAEIEPGRDATGLRDRDRITTGALAGTPFYMAPEQLARERVDARSDQFSFCVAVYAALTGEHPIPRDRANRLPRRRAVPRWLWRALQPGLAAARDQRYPSMDALLSRLAAGPRRARRLAVAAGVAVALAAAAAGLAAVLGASHASGDGSLGGPTCGGADRLFAAAWGPQRGRAIDDAFHASGHADATAMFASASLLLDQYAKRWIAMRTEVCERAQRSNHSEAVLDLRARCLDARRSEVAALIGRLATASAATVDSAVALVRALGPLATCTDDDALQRPMRSDLAARPGVAAVLDADRRVSYLVRDSETSLWQVRNDASGTIRERKLIVDVVAGQPAIVSDAEGHLHVFARRVNRSLAHGSKVSGEVWRTAYVTSDVVDDPAAVLVAGRLVYFVRKTDGWLWRYWQGAGPATTWTGMRVADVAAGRPGVGFDVRGELYSFVRKADGSLWLARHRDPAHPPDRAVKLHENIAGDPTVMLDAVGKMTYYARKTDGSLIAGYQEVAGSEVWHAVILTEGVAGNPAVAFDAEGKQVCLIRKTDGSLWSARQHVPAGGEWHETILAEGIADDPALVLAADGRLRYFVHKADGSLWQGWQDAPLSTTWQAAVAVHEPAF
jgi:serine/threonine protein kinase